MTADPRPLTAELVATLHNVADYLPTSTYEWPNDALNLRFAATFIESIPPLHDAWVAVNPLCQNPQCKFGRIPGDGTYDFAGKRDEPCPACLDSPGVQPFPEWVVKRLLATATLDLSHPNEAYNASTIIDAYLNGAPQADGWHLIDNATGDLLRTIAEQCILRLRSIGSSR